MLPKSPRRHNMHLCFPEKKCSFVCRQRRGIKKSPTIPRKSVISPDGISGSHLAQADMKEKESEASIVVTTPMVMLLRFRFFDLKAIFNRLNGWYITLGCSIKSASFLSVFLIIMFVWELIQWTICNLCALLFTFFHLYWKQISKTCMTSHKKRDHLWLHQRWPLFIPRETLIQSLPDFTLEFLCMARNNLTRIVSYLRKAMTKLCIKILVESDSAIESAFP